MTSLHSTNKLFPSPPMNSPRARLVRTGAAPSRRFSAPSPRHSIESASALGHSERTFRMSACNAESFLRDSASSSTWRRKASSPVSLEIRASSAIAPSKSRPAARAIAERQRSRKAKTSGEGTVPAGFSGATASSSPERDAARSGNPHRATRSHIARASSSAPFRRASSAFSLSRAKSPSAAFRASWMFASTAEIHSGASCRPRASVSASIAALNSSRSMAPRVCSFNSASSRGKTSSRRAGVAPRTSGALSSAGSTFGSIPPTGGAGVPVGGGRRAEEPSPEVTKIRIAIAASPAAARPIRIHGRFRGGPGTAVTFPVRGGAPFLQSWTGAFVACASLPRCGCTAGAGAQDEQMILSAIRRADPPSKSAVVRRLPHREQ